MTHCVDFDEIYENNSIKCVICLIELLEIKFYHQNKWPAFWFEVETWKAMANLVIFIGANANKFYHEICGFGVWNRFIKKVLKSDMLSH